MGGRAGVSRLHLARADDATLECSATHSVSQVDWGH